MAKKTNSPIFGEVELADEDVRTQLEILISQYPVDAFGILNKAFNKINLCITIELKENIDKEV